MSNKIIYSNIVFDKEEKTFTILKGDKGIYPYSKIKKCSVVYEDSGFTGKSPMFSHTVLVSTLQPPTMLPRYVYVGLKITMEDNSIKYVYMSENKIQINSLQFYKESEEAQKAKTFIKNIHK